MGSDGEMAVRAKSGLAMGSASEGIAFTHNPNDLALGGRFAGRWHMRGATKVARAGDPRDVRGQDLWISIKGARAPSPVGTALAGDEPVRENFKASFGGAFLPVVALRQESGQLTFNLPALAFREETTRQLGPQFVDMIDIEHLLRLRLDDVDGARAREDRVEDREATGGAGEGRSRFCRRSRQNGRGPSSLRRAEKPYPLTSLREENRVRLGTRPHVFTDQSITSQPSDK